MTKARLALLAASLLALTAGRTAAAAEPEKPVPTFGLGLGISIGSMFSGGSATTSPLAIYAPINVSGSFRLEPSFGFWYTGRGASTTFVDGSSSQGGYDVDAALGAFYVLRGKLPFDMYGGARVGLIWSGRSQEGASGVVTTTSEMDVYVSPALGLEWSIIPSFSIGGEAQIPLRFYGDPTISVGGVSTTPSRSKFGTGLAAAIFLRFYL